MRTVEELLANPPDEKEVLVEGLLRRRDMVAIGGRQKNGKTTFLLNLAMSIAAGRPNFINFQIPKALKVLGLFFEDDASDFYGKFQLMYPALDPKGKFAFCTQEEIMDWPSPKGRSVAFEHQLKTVVEGFEPDILILDNLSTMVCGDYNDATSIDWVVKLCRSLGQECDCAVILAAHLRKKGRDEVAGILEDRQGFREAIMGSSYLINSANSIWGIERTGDQESVFMGGEQRTTGEEHVSFLMLDDDGVYRQIGGGQSDLLQVLKGPKKRMAWETLRTAQKFKPTDAMRLVCANEKPLLSERTFWRFWEDLKRRELVVEDTEGVFTTHIGG